MDVEGEKERTLQTDGHVYEIEQVRVCVCVWKEWTLQTLAVMYMRLNNVCVCVCVCVCVYVRVKWVAITDTGGHVYEA